ncbi:MULTISPECIES: hypothetical protein [unclassified Streptomyces]|uniref:hypothetical protein n=1 Tax=unclassified Streptomyces TaxID=2593676 RepID=UPI0037F9F642
MRTIDIASAIDYELIRRLDPHVSASTSSQARLADIVRTALAEHLPQLLPRALEIIQLLAEHYDVTEWPPDRQRCAPVPGVRPPAVHRAPPRPGKHQPETVPTPAHPRPGGRRCPSG